MPTISDLDLLEELTDARTVQIRAKAHLAEADRQRWHAREMLMQANRNVVRIKQKLRAAGIPVPGEEQL